MIVTVTPNPSIDRTVRVARLERGELNRTSGPVSEAAGKGLNVARALHRHAVDTIAVLPLAADSASVYLTLLGDAVPIAPVPTRGSIRTNLTVLEADGTVTKLNEPGPAVDDGDVEALLTSVAAIDADWVVGCGSLPPGAPTSFYARLARGASPSRRVAIDASGEALRACISSGPDLIKPNLAELEELLDARLETLGDVVSASGTLVARGVHAVLVSLGADGAVYVDRSRSVHAEATVPRVINSVGAGDALLAGYLSAGGGPDAAATAVAWSVAAIGSSGTWMNAVTDADRAAVHVHREIDRSRRLHGQLVAART
jgi:1-phosphofructokinase